MQVIYEDNHLLVVNKAVGEIVQGDKTGDEPLVETLKHYLKEKYNKHGEVFLGIPHRLDRPTSGVVVFARTSKALSRLCEAFSQHSQDAFNSQNSTFNIQKTYWALTENAPQPAEGRLEHYLLRREAQNKSFVVAKGTPNAQLAVLEYKTLLHTERYHLVEVKLLTGRHHQIRCQLSAIGCPIKGDLKYGAKRSNPDGGISLHARSLELLHPVKKEMMTFVAEPPESMQKIISK